MYAAVLCSDVEALYEQHAPAPQRLQMEFGHFESRASCELEAGYLETDNIVELLSRTARELGNPLCAIVMHESLGSCAPGATAARKQFAKIRFRGKGARFELRRRRQQGGQGSAWNALVWMRGYWITGENRCSGSTTPHVQEHCRRRRFQTLEPDCGGKQSSAPVIRQGIVEDAQWRIELLGAPAPLSSIEWQRNRIEREG